MELENNNNIQLVPLIDLPEFIEECIQLLNEVFFYKFINNLIWL
jgi:hypothetical protein